MKEVILVTGANGQIGSVLVPKLQEIYGLNSVIASDLIGNSSFTGVFEYLDVLNIKRLQEIVRTYKVTQIYHLAAILSAKGEQNPLETWDINMITFLNVLEISRINKIDKVFYPSSIAVFGSEANREYTPQATCLNPSTVYGISKASGENWAQYYTLRYNKDVRSLRFPGIISHQTLPGGGTTDYAVDIYHKAVTDQNFSCYLSQDTMLPMMYIDDAIRGAIELMEAPKNVLKSSTAYNIAAVSYTPEEVANSIKTYYPSFQMTYAPDYRQHIASNWPKVINDNEARNDWKWEHEYDLELITQSMLKNLRLQYKQKEVLK